MTTRMVILMIRIHIVMDTTIIMIMIMTTSILLYHQYMHPNFGLMDILMNTTNMSIAIIMATTMVMITVMITVMFTTIPRQLYHP